MHLLTTPRLVLDAPRESDIPAVLVACQDAETQRWVPLPEPYTRESAEFFVRSYCPHGLASGQYSVWAFRESAEDPLIGVIEVRRDEAPGSASVGSWAAPGGRGRGLVREALAAVAEHALEQGGLGFAQLRWDCLRGNDASRRLAESVGFVFDEAPGRTLWYRGEERPALIGVLRRDGLRG